MKRYLLDTSLLAGFFHQRKKAVDLITPWLQQHTVVTSILVYGEVHDLTLVTIDTDFDRVPPLNVDVVNLKKAA